MYDAFLGDLRVSFADEPIGVDLRWRVYTQGQVFTPSVWNDAFLAAFAQASDCEMITFDKGFSRYPGLEYTILG
jgi:hypothetical protein